MENREQLTSKQIKIQEIFKTMEYNEETENVNQALEWVKTKGNDYWQINEPYELRNACIETEILTTINILNPSSVEEVLTDLGAKKNEWSQLSPLQRSEIMSKIALEIMKNQELFAQLDMISRGLLKSDTESSVSLLTDILGYYSSFCFKQPLEWKPQGIVVGILNENTPLFTFGWILGPCLAAGYKLVLQMPPELYPTSKLILELAEKLGVPKGTLCLIPGKGIDKEVFLSHPAVSIHTIFGSLHSKEYEKHFNKKILHLSPFGTPVLVFDSADLDSASNYLIKAAWGNRGLLPWSARSVFVQESIFEIFVDKLKQELKTVKVFEANRKNVNLSLPSSAIINKVKETKNLGGEIYRDGKNVNYSPTIFIGGNIFTTNVINDDLNDVPILSIIPFRTVNESVALANNSRQGLAASIWTENLTVANEVASKLNVSNVWINSFGLFSHDITSSPFKSSGNAYFGGEEGFSEYILTPLKELAPESNELKNGGDVEKAVNEAKKSNWSSLSKMERGRFLQSFFHQTKEESELIFLIHEILSSSPGNNSISTRDYNVVSFREPVGIIAVEVSSKTSKTLILSALLEGNRVIVLKTLKTENFYSLLAKHLPKGVLTVISYSQQAAKTAALHRELNLYFGEGLSSVFQSLPLKIAAKYRNPKTGIKEARNQVVVVKNIWFNKKQSFI